jgi:aryl-alcohol dehydrogenase-like predicted oxidoreductase
MWGTIGSRYAVDISVPAVIRRASAESFGEKYTELPFTQIALQSVMATEGVTSALVGARTTEYVDDVLTALAAGHEPLGREHWTNYFSSATRQFGVNQQ